MGIEFSSRVNLITGDNGLGKSFLLDVAWWALTRTWAGYRARPNNGDGEISIEFDGFLGEATEHKLRFEPSMQAWRSKASKGLMLPTHAIVIYAQVDGGFSVWDPARNISRATKREPVEGPAAYKFSANEVWDGLERVNVVDNGRDDVLCNGLIRDWASWQREKGQTFEQLCKVLKHLSPLEEQILEPGALTRISLDDVRDIPTIKMPYGEDVPIVYASAGIRRIASLAYLLVWAWQEHVMASKLTSRKIANKILFLIDEPEAHLHPTWQRRVLPSLMDVMDALAGTDQVQVQLIAVTHSPMLLASMEPLFDPEKDSLWMLDLVETGKGKERRREVKLKKDDWHRRGDASSWLRSEVFDLGEARSLEAENALREARSLMESDKKDRKIFDRIYLKLRESMPGDDPFWVEWRAWGWRHGLIKEKKP